MSNLGYEIARLKADAYYLQTQQAAASSSDFETARHDARAAADAVLSLWNEKAVAPLPDEFPSSYRRRLLAQMQAKAPQHAGKNYSSVPPDALDFVEGKVRNDVRAAAYDPSTVPPGTMRQVRERDELGRLVTRYVGNDPAWMNAFMSSGAHGKVNTKLAGIE